MDELSFEEVTEKYPDFPRIIMRKIDTSLRGVVLTERALERAKEEGALYDASADFADSPRSKAGEAGKNPMLLIGGVFFRDGTYVLGLNPAPARSVQPFWKGWTRSGVNSEESRSKGKPYLLDLVSARGGGGLWLLDEKEPVEEVYFAPIPAYFGKKTSRGTPMIKVISSKVPNRISIDISGCCHFFKEKLPCKYCSYAANGSFFRRKDEKSRAKSTEGASHLFGGDLVSLREESHTPESLEDIYETVKEALEEEGWWTNINLIAGSDQRGNEPYENEVNEYIKVLRTLQRCFGTGKIPVHAIASAFPQEQLLRLKEAGLTAYISNIEVWDKKLFEWICPGKAKYFGRQYWIDSILSAVEIFGRGNVSTQLVAGAELAKPYGFKTIEEALESNLEGVEFFARYGVYTTFCILWVDRGSVFYREKQKLPPLEYYLRLAKGINEIRRKYKLSADFNDYRRDGFHPDTDLARLDYNET